METILVHERDACTFEVIAAALQMEGYRVCGLTDTDGNLIEMISRHHPKLILLDCWLNHYSGQRILQWVKAHFPHLPVIALSCDNNIEQQYHKLGFDDYLKKPFDLEMLYQVVRKKLPQRKRHSRKDHKIRSSTPQVNTG